MRRKLRLVFLAIMLMPVATRAADEHAGHSTLTPQEKLGQRLFEQSCGVCHTRPTLLSGMYGPEISKVNMGGQEEVLKTIISNGTARMPGFKYTYTPEQIAAIAAYIKTMPPGTQNVATAPPAKAQ